MTNSKNLFKELVSRATFSGDKAEVESTVFWLLEKVLGISRGDIIVEKPVQVSPQAMDHLVHSISRLNNHEPLQYILGECYFFGRIFKVNPSVLIPRPETEELIQIILRHSFKQSSRVLDIGTGSGCIPITLALELNNVEVFATDVSEKALDMARENATRLKANVNFVLHDILKEEITIDRLSMIVSNPPYITYGEKDQMEPNVLNYEPHLALFVPDEDPVLFYRAIASKARHALEREGLLIFEINGQFGKEVAKIMEENFFGDIEIVRDLSGKERIVKGIKSK